MSVWLVRAGKHGEREEFALEHGVVVAGWSELGDLSACKSRADVMAQLERVYPEARSGTLRNWAAQLWTFRGRIQAGDLVTLPLKGRPTVAFGEILGDYSFVADNPPEARNTRRVRWLKEIPRAQIDQDLRYSLGAFLTGCRIKRNDAEPRLRALLEGRPAPRLQPVTASDDDDPDEAEATLDLDRFARQQIAEHIDRRFKGHALARLVAAVLQAQGYKVYVSPEGPDGGVDILAGHGPMGLDAPRLCVQVKSGDAPIDIKIVRELQGVVQTYKADHGLIVAWGGFKNSVLKEAPAKYFEIRLWNADDLVAAIQAHYAELSDEVQAELPLKRIWTLVLEDDA